MEIERAAKTAAHWSEAQYAHLFANTEHTALGRLVLVITETATEQTMEELPQGSGQAGAHSPLLGFLVARVLDSEWEIENVVVADGARRKGFARKLLEELTSRAQAASAQSLFLEVRESNRAARGLYESIGLTSRGRRKNYYIDPIEDAILYRLDFT